MATSQTIALHRGCFSIAGNVTKSLGIVTDIGVNHLDQQGNFGNLFTYMFGPRFSLNHGGRLTPFARAWWAARGCAVHLYAGMRRSALPRTQSRG